MKILEFWKIKFYWLSCNLLIQQSLTNTRVCALNLNSVCVYVCNGEKINVRVCVVILSTSMSAFFLDAIFRCQGLRKAILCSSILDQVSHCDVVHPIDVNFNWKHPCQLSTFTKQYFVGHFTGNYSRSKKKCVIYLLQNTQF